MQQPLLGQILPSRSASKTIFVNRDLFSNYYLGTLLAREVRKHYGEIGSRMPSSIRRRMLNLWDRTTPTLGSSTTYGQTRERLLSPILSMLGYEELQDLKESDAKFSDIDMQALPPGYYLYQPHDTSADAQHISPLLTKLHTVELDNATFVRLDDEQPNVLTEDEASFFKTEQAERPTVLLSLLSWGQDFDHTFSTARHRNETPGKIMERLLVAGPAQWGLLFNGQRMRLLKRSIIAGRQHYFEVDLEALCESEDDYYFDTFWMLLRAQSFIPGPDGASFLDIVEDQSRAHAMGVSTSLKSSVFGAVEVLMRTLVEHAREQIKQTEESESVQAQQRREVAEDALKHLKPLYDQSLVLLYRLLFVLYAESRDLLPVNNNVYRESYSFIPLRAELEQPDSSYQPDSYRLWESIQSLFRLIHTGCNNSLLVVPAYNGTLFANMRTHYLNTIRVPDNALAEILRNLTLTPSTKERSRERIDYSDLGVEQLGAVYEGLLEFEPRIANEPMVEVRYKSDRIIISQREQRDYTILRTIGEGEFYLGRGAGRKTSGSYYTPQALVDFLVRRTLDPLVLGCTSEKILELKVVDPAMGSGAFLVGACHYLAEAYARALKREADNLQLATQQKTAEAIDIDIISTQEESEEKLSEESVRPYRRLIAERCLYGVDLNAMAVELAKVSLWLTTLAGDRPLTFLDANLRCGNSLINAPLSYYINSNEEKSYAIDRIHPDVNKRLARDLGDTLSSRRSKKVSEYQLYGLISAEDIKQTLRPLADYRSLIATIPSDTVSDVHKKATILNNQIERDPERNRLKRICDLWIASWFWRQPTKTMKKSDPGWAPALDGSVYWELIRYIKTGFTTLPNVDEYEDETQRIVEEVRPFHWELEFPEIYFEEDGKPREKPGFNAVLANPPWDLILPNSREFFAAYDPAYRELERMKADRRQKDLLDDSDEIRQDWDAYVHNLNGQVDYFGLSEVYPHQSAEIDGKQTKAHGNTYKLFLERAYKVLRIDGSCGMIVPSGLYNDQGCAGLRQLFLSHTKINYLFSIENRKKVFPIHSSFKFVLFGFEKKPTANFFEAAFMLQDLDVLSAPERETVYIPTQLIERFSPDTLSIMEFRSQRDLDAIAKIYGDWPLLGDFVSEVWNPIFKREFNLTDDRELFNREERGWPLYEGKMIHQYNHQYSKPNYWIDTNKGIEVLVRIEIQHVEEELDKVALSRGIVRLASTRQERVSLLLEESGRGPLTQDDVCISTETFRLSFRDIARNTDERTMIASILPSEIFEVNTLKHLTQWSFDAEKAIYQLNEIKSCYTYSVPPIVTLFLCGIFNAFVVDYLLRFKVSAHVSAFYVYQIPVPRLAPDNQYCQAIAYRVAQLVCIGQEFDELRTEILGSANAHVATGSAERRQLQNEIDALVAHLYGLNEEDLRHILYAPYTFPLVKHEIKHGVMECFGRVEYLLQHKEE